MTLAEQLESGGAWGRRLIRKGSKVLASAGDLSAMALRAKPDFLIIGTQKAGTTSLHAYLATHPALALAKGRKELHYFNLYHNRGLRWYLSHFPLRWRKEGALWFEATPDYLWHDLAPGRMHRSIGRPKLIAVLRDPAERAYSAWNMWHSFATRADQDPGRADLRSFPEAIEAELASPDRQADLPFHYVRMGEYADHIERWLGYFRREDMLLLDYGEMARDLPTFLDRVCHFLDVPAFAEEAVRNLSQTRHWSGPTRNRTEADEEMLARLRAHYEPFDARLKIVLRFSPGWLNDEAP